MFNYAFSIFSALHLYYRLCNIKCRRMDPLLIIHTSHVQNNMGIDGCQSFHAILFQVNSQSVTIHTLTREIESSAKERATQREHSKMKKKRTLGRRRSSSWWRENISHAFKQVHALLDKGSENTKRVAGKAKPRVASKGHNLMLFSL